MTALWLFLAGVATVLIAGVAASAGIAMGFAGMRSAVPTVVLACLVLSAGIAMIARAFGFGWVGAP